ncbi:MAG: hypothetical protein GXN99_01165 [Candidatus Nanohaloarchaeota archaeon]|nr:hypothetical protein [Candidatus Nanohaloarchaeota archaeon]
MIIAYFKKALQISIKEWLYFLFLGLSIYINWNAFMLRESLIDNYKILGYFIPILSSFLSMFFFFSFAGRVTRHTYDLESYPYIYNLKQSLKATLLFLIYSIILGILTKLFLYLVSSLLWRFIFFLITFSLTFSFILELLKVFFLEKEVFSLYDVFNRIISFKFWSSFLMITAITFFIQLFQSYLFQSILSTNSLSGILLHIVALIRSLIFGYLLVLSLVFFVLIFDLKDDTKFEYVEVSI